MTIQARMAKPSASAMPINIVVKTLRGGDADTDGRATEGQTDVNITCQFCEHIF